MVEQVYDPALGKKRDVFPGEIVPPEQEATLQRLMREEKEAFSKRYEPIADQLTPIQRDAIAQAELALAELKRKEYLKAVRQNPAVIIQDVLKQFDPAYEVITNSFLTLDQSVANLQNDTRRLKDNDTIKGVKQDTLTYVQSLLKGDSDKNQLLQIYSQYIKGDRNENQKLVFDLLTKLGMIPQLESFNSIESLAQGIIGSGNSASSGKPYATGNRGLESIQGLSSNNPGLEGIEATIKYRGLVIDYVSIKATPEALTRIVDRGQYIPYQAPTQ